MPGRLFSLYQRKRVININANVVAAGLLALAPTTAVVWAAKFFIEESRSVAFTAISLASDIVFDVLIYYLLHWVANHWRPMIGGTAAERRELACEPPPFMKDATLIQFERALLSPLYYMTAGGLMHWLQVSHHMRPGFAVLIAFPAGLLLTRIVHTIWGLRSGTFRDNATRAAERKGRDAGPPGAGPDDGDKRAA